MDVSNATMGKHSSAKSKSKGKVTIHIATSIPAAKHAAHVHNHKHVALHPLVTSGWRMGQTVSHNSVWEFSELLAVDDSDDGRNSGDDSDVDETFHGPGAMGAMDDMGDKEDDRGLGRTGETISPVSRAILLH